MSQIIKILQRDGPMISGELLDKMETELGLSRQAARQRLSRVGSPVHKKGGFFQANQKFIYLDETYRTQIWYEGLIKAFSVYAKRYHSIVKAIEYHHGFLDKSLIAEYSFSPISNLKGRARVDKILNELISLEVIHLNEDDQYVLSHLAQHTENLNRHKGAEIARKIILQQFDDWSKKINLTSYNTGRFHSEYGKFQWGFTSPSYIHPLRKMSTAGKLEHGFVLADVLVGNITKHEEVTFFVEKVEILKKQKKLFPFMPFLIVEILDKETLDLLRKKGIIVGFIGKLFGEEYTDLIKTLIQTVENAGAILKKNPDQFLKLMMNLSKLVDGKTANLRGDLFELAVGYYHGQLCRSLDVGKKIFHHGYSREIDVFASYDGELRIAECKGYSHQMSRGEVHEWLTKKIPVIRKWILDQEPYRKKKVIFELWSAGGFEADALDLLNEQKQKSTKIHFEFFGIKEIQIKAKELESPKFREVVDQYYAKNEVGLV